MSAATDYLQAYENYFWRYDDQGKVLAVPEGRTLGYTDRVLGEIVFHLAPQGLPRFGSLLLAVAATTAHGRDTLEDIMEIVDGKVETTSEIDEGFRFAQLLAQVPSEYKKGNLRVQLLRAVFSNSHNSISVRKCRQILRELKAVPLIERHVDAWRELPLDEQAMYVQISNDFKPLAIIGRDLTSVETILQRISDLPETEQELEELELEPGQQGREKRFDELLTERHETFHVGALIPGLISGLQISLHASLPSEQPLGGVADITNKGSFDKLLTSEYAFDDHVLLSRLANNEALYKHREIPPAENTDPRVLLIDNTLKNWGNIRTVSFAAALAIVKHPKNRLPCRIFLVDRSFREIAFGTVADVIDALSNPDGSLDPGIGLKNLFAREDLKASELFFLGTAASLAAPEMLRFSADAVKRIDHWIHPDERGGLKVYKNPKRGKRLVQELKIPLGRLWSRPKPRRVVGTSYGDADYPILLPGMRLKSSWRDEQHVYGLTKNSALVRLYSSREGVAKGREWIDTGWEIVSGDVRPKDILKAVITNDDLSVTALFVTNTRIFTLTSYPGGERITLAPDRRLHKLKGRNFYVEDGVFKVDVLEATICIDLKGQIIKQALGAKRADVKDHFKNQTSFFFRQISQVSITNDHHLRIRKHDLVLEHDRLILRHRGHLEVDAKITAGNEVPGTFTFPDGSSIVHNPNGMLVLRSADKSLPEVFVPTRLDVSLGMATTEIYTGPVYYRKKHRIELIFSNPQGRAAEFAGIVNGCLDQVNLNRVEEMIENGLITCPDEESFDRLESALGDFTYRVRSRGIKQQQIAPPDFYERYIQSFINHIVNHGTDA